jgi:hypothetical protein
MTLSSKRLKLDKTILYATKRSIASIVAELTEKGYNLSECRIEMQEHADYINCAVVKCWLEETDEEFADRLLREANTAKRTEERERGLLAYLKAKYETPH